MAIIILKFDSYPPLASQSPQLPSLFPFVCRRGSHNKCGETIRRKPGSTNTVGQALAQLSPGTSDTTVLRDYDVCRGSLTQFPHSMSRRVWEPKSVSRRKSKNTRFSLAVICFARFPVKDPDEAARGHAQLSRFLRVRDGKLTTFSTSSRTASNHSQVESILSVRLFFA